MAYASINFQTKKALKEAVKNGQTVTVYSPGPFGCKTDGTESLEGPWYPQPHKWYASVRVENGIVVKVLS
jgi:hypothetical protein